MTMVYLIGMGPGGPDYLTMQAIAALRKVDVFFILEKDGSGKEALAAARRRILETYREPGSYRVVVAQSPERAPAGADYLEVVADWRQRKVDLFAQLIAENLTEGATGGFLVWGDPAWYDGCIDILHQIEQERRLAMQFEVIPGISSVQALAARHKVPLNAVAGDVLITTARRMEAGACDGHESTVVMLDSNAAFRRIAPEGLDIYWGGYVGTEDEVLMSGRLEEVGPAIAEAVAREKRRHGWILDIYLLKRRRGAS